MDEQIGQNAENDNVNSETDIAVNLWRGGKLYRFLLDIPLESSTEKWVLAIIGSYFNVDLDKPFSQKSAWPSYETISKDASLNIRTIKRVVQSLEIGGFIRAKRRVKSKGNFNTNLYSIEPSLPYFYSYFELVRDLKIADAEDLPLCRSRVETASLEVSKCLKSIGRSWSDLAEKRPGLYKVCIEPWRESERQRGGITPFDQAMKGSDTEPPLEIIDESSTRGGGTESPGGGTESPGGGTESPGGGTESPGGGTESPGGGTESPKGVTKLRIMNHQATLGASAPRNAPYCTKEIDENQAREGSAMEVYSPTETKSKRSAPANVRETSSKDLENAQTFC